MCDINASAVAAIAQQRAQNRMAAYHRMMLRRLELPEDRSEEESADQRLRLQEAEATIKELRDRLAVAKSGECPICDAKRRADAARAAKYRRRRGGKE